MGTQADYRDGRDAVSGDLVTIVPANYQPEHFTDRSDDARFELQAESIATAEERFETHRDRKLQAAIGVLRTMIAEAEAGSGKAASEVIQAASSDLMIAFLADRLKEAKDLIPGHVDNLPARHRIDTALAAAGL